MADFVQTMKDWRRMCDSMQGQKAACTKCPLGSDLCKGPWQEETMPPWELAERRINTWAAEHPVVYPTWGEWFVSRGMLPEKWDNLTSAYMNVGCVPNLIHSPIPADIAEKLGLQPKEG